MTSPGLYGRVVAPLPDTDDDFVHVKFPLQDGGQEVVPCRWPGGTVPSVGDACCVIFTDEHPWALGLGG